MSFAKSGSDSLQIFWRIEEWFPELGKANLALLKLYHDELIRFNMTLNLITVKSISNCDLVHFADCILACRIIKKVIKQDAVSDFGTGNGFPGLIMGILYPETKLSLYESDKRKVDFLKHMITVLGLKNVVVINQMVETIPDQSIKYAMSRGVASISKAVLSTRRVFAVGGEFLHLKGDEWATEVGSMPIQVCSYWRPELVEQYDLPLGNQKFAVIRTVKLKN